MKRLALLVIVVAGCGPGGGSNDQCAAIGPGDLVITEVFSDYAAPAGSSGADDGKEWFEVYNASSAAIDMAGLTVTHAKPDDTMPKQHTMASLTVAPGGYAVLGDVDPMFVTGFLNYGYGVDLGSFFNTGGGKLTLACGDTEIDHAIYGDATTGQSFGFDGGQTPDYQANDDLAQWCVTPNDPTYQFEDSNFGTPGAPNFDCQGTTPGMCMDNGVARATVPPTAGDLVIDEVMANPTGTDGPNEWFEVYAVNPFDLNDVLLTHGTATPSPIRSDTCIHANAGDYLVVAASADPASNGMLPRVDATFSFALSNATGDLGIEDPSGNLVDHVTWTNATSGKSRGLDPDLLDPATNDAESNWCDATTAWATGDLGSPGAANEQCTILPPQGMCNDPGTNTLRAIVPPTASQLVITEVMPSPSGDDTKQEWMEARANASFDLNELELDRAGDTSAPNKIAAADCIHLDAGQYALFARSSDSTLNGGLPAVDATFSFSMVTSGDARILASDGTTVIDAVTWTNAVGNKARQLSASVIAAADAATQNDNTALWCDATTVYNGTDTGTPKADNDVTCP